MTPRSGSSCNPPLKGKTRGAVFIAGSGHCRAAIWLCMYYGLWPSNPHAQKEVTGTRERCSEASQRPRGRPRITAAIFIVRNGMMSESMGYTACGPAARRSSAALPTATSPTSPLAAQPGARSRPWSRLKAIAGPSRTAPSRPYRNPTAVSADGWSCLPNLSAARRRRRHGAPHHRRG